MDSNEQDVLVADRQRQGTHEVNANVMEWVARWPIRKGVQVLLWRVSCFLTLLTATDEHVEIFGIRSGKTLSYVSVVLKTLKYPPVQEA